MGTPPVNENSDAVVGDESRQSQCFWGQMARKGVQANLGLILGWAIGRVRSRVRVAWLYINP